MRNCLLLSKENCKLIKQSVTVYNLFRSPGRNTLYQSNPQEGMRACQTDGLLQEAKKVHIQPGFAPLALSRCKLSWKFYNDSEEGDPRAITSYAAQ